jgi:hypothetical protein
MSALIRPPDPMPRVGREAVRLAFYPECHEEVVRGGFAEPCERLAVALRLDFNESTEGAPYPVCARHVSKRRGCMVSLLEVMGVKP